jgi:hypothetical protein
VSGQGMDIDKQTPRMRFKQNELVYYYKGKNDYGITRMAKSEVL